MKRYQTQQKVEQRIGQDLVIETSNGVFWFFFFSLKEMWWIFCLEATSIRQSKQMSLNNCNYGDHNFCSSRPWSICFEAPKWTSEKHQLIFAFAKITNPERFTIHPSSESPPCRNVRFISATPESIADL